MLKSYTATPNGISIWGNALQKHTNKLDVLQNKVTRAITSSKCNSSTSTTALFKQLNIPKFKDQYEHNVEL